MRRAVSSNRFGGIFEINVYVVICFQCLIEPKACYNVNTSRELLGVWQGELYNCTWMYVSLEGSMVENVIACT